MKRSVFLILTLILAACLPSQPVILPAETAAALTLAARPATATPAPTATVIPTATPTQDPRPPTPGLDLTLPGAYCLPTGSARVHGLVTRVLSGDTIEVAAANQTWIVRYIGLDSPEISVPAEWQAAPALRLNEELVGGKNVILIQDVTDTDDEGMKPRYVVSGGVFVNYEILRQGFGELWERSPDLACKDAFIAAQVEAQAAVRGVWQPTPVPTFTAPPTATITLTPGPATATVEPVCVCSGGYSCTSFRTQREAQRCYDYCLRSGFGPILRDQNNNGLVCEGLN